MSSCAVILIAIAPTAASRRTSAPGATMRVAGGASGRTTMAMVCRTSPVDPRSISTSDASARKSAAASSLRTFTARSAVPMDARALDGQCVKVRCTRAPAITSSLVGRRRWTRGIRV